MKKKPWSKTLCILMCASLLMAQGCSTKPQTLPTVTVSSHLLVPPQPLPKVQRQSDGTMTGGQCLSSLVDLYDVAGKQRAQLIELQTQIKVITGQ